MADTMQFDLVSPERSLASLQATAVQIPGAEGDMTAMPMHAPTLTTLRAGVLKVDSPKGTTEYLVTGGFAQISAEGLSVLAEKAIPMDELTREYLDALIADARGAYETAKKADGPYGLVEDAAKLLADTEYLGVYVSL